MKWVEALGFSGVRGSQLPPSGKPTQSVLIVISISLMIITWCVHNPPGQIKERNIVAYSALFRCSISYRNRETTFRGGCAIDPERGGRIEFRDPMGATVVLVLLDKERATAVSPFKNLKCTWTESGSEFPWSPADLWSVFSGEYPASNLRSKGLTTTAKWRNDSGKVRAWFTCSGEGLPLKARLKGPGPLELTIRFSNPEPSRFKKDTFLLPEVLSFPEADPSDVFSGFLP